jgi:hypothetical protein
MPLRGRAEITARILAEAGLADQVADGAALRKGIGKLFKREPASSWRDHLKAVVAKLRTSK